MSRIIWWMLTIHEFARWVADRIENLKLVLLVWIDSRYLNIGRESYDDKNNNICKYILKFDSIDSIRYTSLHIIFQTSWKLMNHFIVLSCTDFHKIVSSNLCSISVNKGCFLDFVCFVKVSIMIKVKLDNCIHLNIKQ